MGYVGSGLGVLKYEILDTGGGSSKVGRDSVRSSVPVQTLDIHEWDVGDTWSTNLFTPDFELVCITAPYFYTQWFLPSFIDRPVLPLVYAVEDPGSIVNRRLGFHGWLVIFCPSITICASWDRRSLVWGLTSWRNFLVVLMDNYFVLIQITRQRQSLS